MSNTRSSCGVRTADVDWAWETEKTTAAFWNHLPLLYVGYQARGQDNPLKAQRSVFRFWSVRRTRGPGSINIFFMPAHGRKRKTGLLVRSSVRYKWKRRTLVECHSLEMICRSVLLRSQKSGSVPSYLGYILYAIPDQAIIPSTARASRRFEEMRGYGTATSLSWHLIIACRCQ